MRRIFFLQGQLIIAFALNACSGLTPQASPTPLPSASSTATFIPTATESPSVTPSPSPSSTVTASATPSETPMPTPEGLFAIVRPEMLSCRYGPGGAYLLRTTLYEGEKVEILGHMLLHDNWLLVHRVTRTDYNCWVSGNFLDWVAEPDYVPYIEYPHLVMPWSPYYDALTGIHAKREGNVVVVSWDELELRAGDDSLQIPYLIEAWVCQDGEFVFRAIGSKSLIAEVLDEAGCAEPSHARVMGAEKHGYTRWRQIAWPPH